MKIYINRKSIKGPWGGGTKTLGVLEQKITSRGHELVSNLSENIDVIICYDPRPNNDGVWYQDFINYKLSNPKCKIVQRVGDVGSHSKPELNSLLKQIVNLGTTDFFIFPSVWARKMIEHSNDNFSVIPNSPLKDFYEERRTDPSSDEIIRLVTHHWSDNDKKGFKLYQKLGKLINDGLIINEKKVYLTYIGRYSKNYSSEGIRLINPMGVDNLKKELPQYSFYLTASEEEAGANHVLEAMAAGLPVLYRKGGGSINEYCKGFGLEYESLEDLINKISKIDDNSIEKKKSVLKYSKTADEVAESYIKIIEKLV